MTWEGWALIIGGAVLLVGGIIWWGKYGSQGSGE